MKLPISLRGVPRHLATIADRIPEKEKKKKDRYGNVHSSVQQDTDVIRWNRIRVYTSVGVRMAHMLFCFSLVLTILGTCELQEAGNSQSHSHI